MKIIRAAVDRPVTIYMLYLAVILLGFVSLRELSVDLLPDISYPRLSVVTRFTGVAPEEMETLVTRPLESAVSRIPGLRRVESISKEGVSYMTLEFDWGTNMDFTMLHAREQLDNARDALPEDAENPTIIALDPQSKPIMTLALSGARSLLELKEFAEELVKPRLEQVEGIGAAEITGGVEREIHIEVDPQKLSLFGLTISEVAQRIAAFNSNLQGGTIRKGTFKYALRVVGEFESLGEIGEIAIKTTADRGVVRLRDIARVEDGIKERQGITRIDGKESIGLLVRKESGANTVKVTKLAQEVLDQIRRETQGIDVRVVNEQARSIRDAIGAVRDELIQGGILAFLILLIFLQEWKTPLIIDVVIPISVIGTFSLLFFSKITINIMSLGGLALGVGMLDDCAVVVSENIFRHRSLGKSHAQAAYDGAREIAGAVVATALTTVVVFLPVIYVHGVSGQLFKDTALTVTISLLMSLLVSLTLLPTLLSRTFRVPGMNATPREKGASRPRWAKPKSPFGWLLLPIFGLRWVFYIIVRGVGFVLDFVFSWLAQAVVLLAKLVYWPIKPVLAIVFRGFNAFYTRFVAWYSRALTWSLDHKKAILGWSVAFFGLTFGLGFFLKSELMPKLATNTFEMSLRAPVDYSLEQTSEIAALLEGELGHRPEVKAVMAQVGLVSGLESADPDVSLNSARLFVEVARPDQLDGVLEVLRRRLTAFPDVSYSVTREQTTLSQFLAFSAAEIGLRIKGDDLERLRELSEALMVKLRKIPGIVDVASNWGEGKPEFKVSVRRDALEKYAGLTPAGIGDFIVGAVRGRIATQFNEMEKKYDILVRLEGATQRNIDALLDAPYPLQGKLIPLRELVAAEIVRGPKEIRRENQGREVLVTAGLRGTKISQAAPAVEKAVQSIELPSDYRIVIGGEREEMNKSFKSLIFALLLAALLTYMIMAAQFESLLHPLLVMFTIPMGVAGAIVALLLTGQTINVISIIGLVVLIGLVVDDAIVEVDYANLLRKQGKALRPAVHEACMTRLRPILIASFSTIFGLLPMALGLESGGELMRPLGVVVLSGMTFSTLLTLILIPVMYEAVEKRKRS
jgi:HAE1 family hydrophobic/amphiphilic exporter-1